MRLAEYMAAEAKDSKAFWYMASGDRLNVLEEAIQALEDIRALPDDSTADAAKQIASKALGAQQEDKETTP
jgi:hypothetical protein